MSEIKTKRIKDWATLISALRTGDVIPVDGPDGTAKMTKDTLLELTAQNALAGIVAPAFDHTRTSENPYKKYDFVEKDGVTYQFIVDEFYGEWTGVGVRRVSLEEISTTKRSLDETNDRVKNCHSYTDMLFAITDKNGYISFAVNNDGRIIGAINDKRLIELAEDGFVISDRNGYIGFAVQNNGEVIYNDYGDVKKPSLVLPSFIPCVVDRVHYIYYESILKNGWLNGLYVAGNTRRRELVRIERAAGVENILLSVKTDDGKIVANGSVVLKKIARDVAGSYTICVCGDSKTENVSKLAQVLNICDWDGYLNITFVGSKQSSRPDSDGNARQVRNEGYSGLGVDDLCQSPTVGGRTNIFYDAEIVGDNKFSFAKGVESLGVTPDILWIDHGANQSTLNKDMIHSCYESIINSVKEYNTANGTSVKVVISIQEFGGCRQTVTSNGQQLGEMTLDNDEFICVGDYIEWFDNRENEGVFICPQYLCIDPYNDYPMAAIPASLSIGNATERIVALDTVHPGLNLHSYSDTTTYKLGDSLKISDTQGAVCIKDGIVGIAPVDDKVNWSFTLGTNAEAGYYKLAEMYYATIKYIASLT